MTNSIEVLSTQVIDLQSRLTFQEDALQALNDQVALQTQELQLARQHILMLNQKLNDLFLQLEQKMAEPLQERPPHY